MRARHWLLMLCVALVCGCGGPPAPLKGMWSASPAACAAGLGITFRVDAVRARFGSAAIVLLPRPRYLMRATADGGVVRITYALPAEGGTRPLAEGVIELQWSRASARLLPIRRRFIDLRTGAATVPLKPDALDHALAVTRCPRRPDQNAAT